MKKYFIDTNVIIYSNDSRDRKKQAIALEWIGNKMNPRFLSSKSSLSSLD